jgi:hypothetical protein
MRRLGRSNAPVTNATTGASSIAPIVLPQVGQKARDDHSDDRHVDGTPPGPVHSIPAAGYSTQDKVGAPEWR